MDLLEKKIQNIQIEFLSKVWVGTGQSFTKGNHTFMVN